MQVGWYQVLCGALAWLSRKWNWKHRCSIIVLDRLQYGEVNYYSSVHGKSNIGKSFSFPTRRRPKLTSTNATVVREPFRTCAHRYLPIPTSIDDCNQNMNGVDSFDQRLAAFDAQLRSRRNWLAIYYFLLDISLANIVSISRMQKWVEGSTSTAHIRLSLARQVFVEAKSSNTWI